MSEAAIDLVDKLVRRVPALEPMFREHVADNFGEILPHLFFGDLTRFVVKEFLQLGKARSTREPEAGQLEELLDLLEEPLPPDQKRSLS